MVISIFLPINSTIKLSKETKKLTVWRRKMNVWKNRIEKILIDIWSLERERCLIWLLIRIRKLWDWRKLYMNLRVDMMESTSMKVRLNNLIRCSWNKTKTSKKNSWIKMSMNKKRLKSIEISLKGSGIKNNFNWCSERTSSSNNNYRMLDRSDKVKLVVVEP